MLTCNNNNSIKTRVLHCSLIFYNQFHFNFFCFLSHECAHLAIFFSFQNIKDVPIQVLRTRLEHRKLLGEPAFSFENYANDYRATIEHLGQINT